MILNRLSPISILAAVTALLCACGGSDGDDRQVSEIRTLSNRSDLISSGDALVEVVLPSGADPSLLKVLLNGKDVTSNFAVREDGRVKGMIEGLEEGPNTLTASINADRAPAGRTIINHPKGGPIFSGPQLTPWTCTTAENGLDSPQDEKCNASTKVEYFYRSTDPGKPGFLPYSTTSPPTDVSTTTTDQGRTVPFIVKRERGTLNRFIYDITVLADPTQQISPFNPPTGWNGKMYHTFVGGIGTGRSQASAQPFGLVTSWANQPGDVVSTATALSLGYATTSSSGTVFGQSGNSVTSAEVLMMVKERVVETLGEIRYTLAQGASGGSMQQHLIGNAYPGLLDGIMPSASYPDAYTTNNEIQDCSLLIRYFDTNPVLWNDVTKQNAVMENANESPGTCRNWLQFGFDRALMDPAVGELHEYQVNILGKRADGSANRSYDNVGIQYGLKALRAGSISAEDFVHLNQNVGGRAIDWSWTPARSAADPAALERLYRSGQVNLGTGLASVPIIDLRGQSYGCENFEIHACSKTWAMRERLTKANGQATNQVILHAATGDAAAQASIAEEALRLMDRWVSAIKSDNSNDSLASKVVRHKPSDAQDACWINGVRTTDTSACRAAFPLFGNPRTGAGSPLAADVMKCQLKPLDRTGYGVAFTDVQWTRLQAIFNSGVCDWNAPSVGQVPMVPWLNFAKGPGGEPLGDAP